MVRLLAARTAVTSCSTWLLGPRARASAACSQAAARTREFDLEVGGTPRAATEEHIRRGLPPGEARRQAILRFGGPVQIKEQQHERPRPAVRRNDAAGRPLRRPRAAQEPGVLAGRDRHARDRHRRRHRGVQRRRRRAAAAAALQGAGRTGAHLRDQPARRWTRNIAAPANYADWRARNKSFTDIARLRAVQHERQRRRRRVPHRIRRAAGAEGARRQRQPVPASSAPRRSSAARSPKRNSGKAGRASPILSYGLWQSAFGGDPAIVGKTDHAERPRLRRRRRDAARRSSFPAATSSCGSPFGYTPQLVTTSRRPHWLGVVARRRPGVSFEQARDDMTGIARAAGAAVSRHQHADGRAARAAARELRERPRTALLMLSGAVGLLFLIVCANIANLQLGRGVSRTRELAIRRALGAGRARILRQLLTESLVLSVVGGALGFGLAALARIALHALRRVRDPAVRRACRPIAAVLFFALGAVAGRADHLRHRAGAEHVAQRAGRPSAASRRRARRGGCAICSSPAEVALSIVLVVGAVLLAAQPRSPAGRRSRIHQGARDHASR